jgi:translation initiation factor 2 subunit 1
MSDCRFYEKTTPEVDDLVMVQISRIEEHGAYATLLEYDGLEGMILISELSKRRIRSISKLVRIGQIQCCAVLRVDKGNIDLSKKRVSSEEARAFEMKYSNFKAVHAIMKTVASNLSLEAEKICEVISWPLSRSGGSSYEALRRIASGSGDEFLRLLRENPRFTQDIEQALVEVVNRKLTPQPVKIRADIEVSCFGYSGIQAVKSAILKGKSLSSSDVQLSIRLVAPPQYMIVTSTFMKDAGFNIIDNCIDVIKKEIEALGGKFSLKEKPAVVGEDESAMIDASDEESSSASGSDSSDSSSSDE